jgi:hypothetical protein
VSICWKYLVHCTDSTLQTTEPPSALSVLLFYPQTSLEITLASSIIITPKWWTLPRPAKPPPPIPRPPPSLWNCTPRTYSSATRQFMSSANQPSSSTSKTAERSSSSQIRLENTRLRQKPPYLLQPVMATTSYAAGANCLTSKCPKVPKCM